MTIFFQKIALASPLKSHRGITIPPNSQKRFKTPFREFQPYFFSDPLDPNEVIFPSSCFCVSFCYTKSTATQMVYLCIAMLHKYTIPKTEIELSINRKASMSFATQMTA